MAVKFAAGHTETVGLDSEGLISVDTKDVSEIEVDDDSIDADINDIAKPNQIGSSKTVVQEKSTLTRTSFAVYSTGVSGKRKLLEYDIAKLVKVGAFKSMFAYGTVFTMDTSIYKALFWQFLLALLSGSATIFQSELTRDDLQGLVAFSFYLGNFVPFLLSFWVSLAVKRWWSLRTDALGEVLCSTCNLCMIMAALFPDTDRCRHVRNQVLRYGLASVVLMLQAARDNADLGQIRAKGLLTKEETGIIAKQDLYQRSMMMWPWAVKLVFHTFEENHLPLGVFNEVMLQSTKARDGIQTIHTYLETQVPLAYVHLIALLVTLTSIAVSVKSGQVVFLAVLNLIRGKGHSEDAWEILTEVVYWLMVQVIYYGLLAITYFMHDPFGDDVLDFPIQAYSDYVFDACKALLKARCCPAERRLFAESERVKAQWRSSFQSGSEASDVESEMIEIAALRSAGTLTMRLTEELEEKVEERLEAKVKDKCNELMELVKRVDSKLPVLDLFVGIQKRHADRRAATLAKQQQMLFSPITPTGITKK